MLATRYSARSRHRRGVTLVEMMVAITVTLIMIAALTQAFQSISESVSDSRAMITITEATRKTAMTLQRDLDGLTVPARPWPESGSGLGYLEIVEGKGSDMNPQPTLDLSSITPTQEQISYQNLLGDFDDLIMFTSRSKDEPFVGRVQRRYLGYANNPDRHEAVDSSLAEVIWWTNFDSFNDAEQGGQPPNGLQDDTEEEPVGQATSGKLDLDNNETIVLRRRNLLIRPDLNNANGDLGIPVSGGGTPTPREIVSEFLANNDISVRFRLRPGTTDYYLAANTLADLTRRENRAGHWTFSNTGAYVSPLVGPNQFRMSNTLLNRDSPPFLYRIGPDQQTSTQYTTDQNGIKSLTGDASMLTNVLAFDIRVYDPQAPILSVDGVAMSPVSRGDFTNRTAYPPPNGSGDYDPSQTWTDSQNRTIRVLGTGDFVDLNYSDGANTSTGSDHSLFSGNHFGFGSTKGLQQSIYWRLPTIVNPTSAPQTYVAFTYDTWSWDYERDGLNNEPTGTGIDEGTDGIDNNNRNGVDDRCGACRSRSGSTINRRVRCGSSRSSPISRRSNFTSE